MKTKEWLKKKREELGITQQELADKAGINKFTIENIEQGRRLGSAETWNKIEAYLEGDEEKTSFDSVDLIEELKNDIDEFGEDNTCYIIYKVVNNSIIFVDYQPDVEEMPFNPNEELKNDEKYMKTSLQYALEVFESQNKLF